MRFDERCALYRVTNPKQMLLIWLMIFGGGWTSLQNLQHFGNLGAASGWQKLGAIAGVTWGIIAVIGTWFIVRQYRRGLDIAIMTDGLIVHLPGFKGDLIPWCDIGSASVKDRPTGKSQVALMFLRSKNKQVCLGGFANLFPHRADVERFVNEVNRRREAAAATEESSAPVRANSEGTSTPRL